MQTDEKISGTNNPQNKQPVILTKKDIMFQVDEDGKAIPELVDVEIYDKVLDDEIINVTMELDNSITLHTTITDQLKQTHKSHTFELDKLRTRVKELTELKEITDQQTKLLLDTQTDLKKKEEVLTKLCFDTETRILAFKNKANECRKDLRQLEEMRNKEKLISKIEATPCKIAESHKYFTKRMYKDKDGKWINPVDDEDITYISHLLSEHVTNPNMTVQEWDSAKPNLRLVCKDAIAEISYYQRPSPREMLVDKRRSEALKNIFGE